MSEIKYDNHIEEYSNSLKNEEIMLHYETWLNTDNLDYWHHSRLRSFLEVIVKHFPNESWLTVGDGRFGTDANCLLKLGVNDVHASDLSDDLLKIGFEKGFIKEFSSQNAEDLKFEDNSFDFVYCKESLHHFPRPYIALNEMFRVSKKGVIFTEPRDQSIDKSVLDIILKFFKLILKKNVSNHNFEEVGNYIYSFSEKELEKFLLGMHHTNISFLGINDLYIKGMEYVSVNPKDFLDRLFYMKYKFKLFFLNLLCKLHLKKTGLLTVILHKKEPNKNFLEALEKEGFLNKSLPENPYIEN